nr:Mur ligase family protein [Spirochaetota bacterium]
YYKYFEGLKDAFLQYINNVPFYGYAVLCIDDPAVVSILPRVERPYFTYGLSEEADFRASDIRFEDGMTRYSCYFHNEYLGEIAIKLLGRHNVVNSLAVVTVARELEIPFECIRDGFAEFEGVGRRLEIIGEAAGVMVIDDYGHHPTEIAATLSAVKSLGRRIVTIFQPHRYSRTQLLWDEFGKSFPDTDLLFLADIYPASEIPIDGVSSELIADSYLKHHGKEAHIIKSFEKIPEILADSVEEGDVVLTLGAGDIYRCGEQILELLRKR